MVARNNRLAGLRAKRQGQAFEDIFYRACVAKRVAITRFPEGCRRIGPKRLVQVKTPFDWVVSYKNRTALIDTKSVSGAFFPNSAIEGHQVSEMLKHAEHGTIGGYVVWLRLVNHVIFIPATHLAANYEVRGSIGHMNANVTLLGPCGNIDITQIFS